MKYDIREPYTKDDLSGSSGGEEAYVDIQDPMYLGNGGNCSCNRCSA